VVAEPVVEQTVEQPVAELVADEPVVDEPVVDEQVAEAETVSQPPQTDPAPQAQTVTRIEAPVAASTLTRTKYVAPKYPRAAQRRGINGWVDVVFTVDIDGTVAEVAIRNSEPDGTFVGAATSAVENWEFEPVIENGVAVQKRAAVRMMFALE